MHSLLVMYIVMTSVWHRSLSQQSILNVILWLLEKLRKLNAKPKIYLIAMFRGLAMVRCYIKMLL